MCGARVSSSAVAMALSVMFLAAPAIAEADPYIVLGDSYSTSGYVPEVYGHFQSTLGATELLNHAVAGQTAATAVTSQLPLAVSDINGPSDAKAVTVLLGANDVLGGSCQSTRDDPPCTVRASLDTILSQLGAALDDDPGPEAYVAGLYPNPQEGTGAGGTLGEADLDMRLLGADGVSTSSDTTGVNVGLDDVIRQVAAANGAAVADPYDAFVACGTACHGDGIHPNSQGYHLIAQAFCGGTCHAPPAPPGGDADTTPPETTITSKPAAKTKHRKARIEFASSEPGSHFVCSLNGALFEPCASGIELGSRKGANSFHVEAIDAAGNVDSSPASASWKFKKKQHRH